MDKKPFTFGGRLWSDGIFSVRSS